MPIYKLSSKHKIGPLKFGKKIEKKVNIFPHTFTIIEKHLVAFNTTTYPLQKKHERWIKVLNEHEVYVFKLTKNNCYSCNYLYGKLVKQNINKDPHISKYLQWVEN